MCYVGGTGLGLKNYFKKSLELKDYSVRQIWKTKAHRTTLEVFLRNKKQNQPVEFPGLKNMISIYSKDCSQPKFARF
jgi:hypothetical protein